MFMGNISKSFTLILVVLLGLSSLIVVESASAQSATSYPVIIATPSPTPYVYVSPAPTPTPTSNIALSYSEVSRDTVGDDTRIVLAVNAQYNFGDSVTFNYQDFVLNIFRPRGGVPIAAKILLHTSDANPQESGSITIGSTNPEADFTLTFIFSTMQEGFEGPVEFSSYQLVYNSNTESVTPSVASVASPTPTEPPTTTPSLTPANISLSMNQTSLVALGIGIAAAAIVACVGLIIYSRKRKG
jgi:hypothetical protein